jgi:hypothetical protein
VVSFDTMSDSGRPASLAIRLLTRLFYQESFVPRPQHFLLGMTETTVSSSRRPRLTG